MVGAATPAYDLSLTEVMSPMLTYPLRANPVPSAHVKGSSAFGQSDFHPGESAAMPEPKAPRAIERLDKNGAGNADAMIVDWLRSGVDGLTLIQAMRQQRVRSPVLVLSALAAIRGLRAGGDDHLTKTSAIVELVARIETLLRRLDEEPETILSVGPVELDLLARTAKRGERRLELLPREFCLLAYMMRREDQLVTRTMLFKEVWNYNFVPNSNLVDVHIGRLRRKLDQPAERPMIHTVKRKGFVLRATA
jgi:two-component system OmpR family response regulator